MHLPDHAMRLLGEQLRAWRENAGLSQNQLAKDMLVDRSLIPHVEAGRKPLTRDNTARVDEILGTAGALTKLRGYLETQAASVITPQRRDDLATALSQLSVTLQTWHPNSTPAIAPTGPDMPGWAHPHLLDALTHVTQKNPMDRRDFTSSSATVLSALPLLTNHLPLPVVGKRIGAEIITAIRQRTTTLRGLDDQLGSFDLLGVANAEVQHSLWILRNNTYPERTGSALARTMAEQLLFCGWLAFDSLRHAAAENYWMTAIRAARAAHNPQLETIAIGWLGRQATWLGHTQDAVHLCGLAVDRSAHLPSLDRAFSAGFYARAQALAGNMMESQKAMEEAIRHHTRSAGGDAQAYWLTGGHLEDLAGQSCLLTHRPAAALAHLQRATATLDPYPRDAAENLTWQAIAHVRTHELEAACVAGKQALGMVNGHIASPRVKSAADQLRRELEPYRDVPMAQELLDLRGRDCP